MTDILRPRDEQDVSEAVARALAQEKTIEIVGQGTKRAIGRAAQTDMTLDLSRLSGIELYEPEELVLSAKAGTPIGEIEKALARNEQELAFEPMDCAPLLGGKPGRGTLGGTIAVNLSGPRRVKAGALRDFALGVQAVSGRGERFKAGGRVVKNVTGYDLPKLLAGSWGTLAVLTTVTVRVAPAPETETTVLFPAADAAAAVDLMSRALGSPHDVSAAAFVPQRGAAMRIEGFGASVAARVRGLVESLAHDAAELLVNGESRAFWTKIGAAAELADWPCVVRISVPPSDAPHVVAALTPEHYQLDWGGGLIWAAFETVDIARVRRLLTEGHATLWKAPRALRESADVFPPQPPAIKAISARLKSALDPAGRLNPGRLGAIEAGR